jgi:hypothetical protein
MKIQFLKPHMSFSEGDVTEVADQLGNYLIRVSAAEEHSDDEDKPKRGRKKQTKEFKQDLETK